MNDKPTLHAAVYGLIFSAVTTAILVALHTVSTGGGKPAPRIIILLGGSMPEGIIQFITYLAFFWGMVEVFNRQRNVKYQRESFHMHILPEKEHWVLSPDDAMKLRLEVVELEKKKKYILTTLIRKAITKFRASQSVSEVMDIVSTQVKINLNKAESGQSIIRYLAWAIPSIGFIGTILGIAGSLGLAGSVESSEGMEAVTGALNVAFDTTLVALLLSLIMMYYYHDLQEKEELLHSDVEEYVTDNLVNRLNPEV